MSTTVEYDILVEVLDAVKDLKKLQTETKKTKDGLDDTRKSGTEMAGDIGAAFTGLIGAASLVAGAVGKITGAFIDAAKASFELTRSVVDNINDLNDLSTVSGISAQNIEALRTAFVASGQSADSANTILKMFPRIMNQLSNETSDASKVFRGLGLSMRDASGNAKSADQVFIEMIHAVQGIDDQTQKARTAMALFGRQASGVVQALGADKFEAFTDAVERYGTRAGPEASRSAALFQKNLALLDLIVKRTKQSLVENTGVLDLFSNVLKRVVAVIAGLNAALGVASPLLSAVTKATVRLGKAFSQFLINTFVQQIILVSGLIQKFESFVSIANDVSEALTGERIFSALEVGLDAAVLSVDTLIDATRRGVEAFRAETDALDETTSTKDEASKTTQQLAADYKMIEAVLAKLNKATKENTKATDDSSKRAARRAKLLADLAKRTEKAEAEISQIQKSATSDLLSALDQINQREEERLQRLREITKEQKISTDEAQRAVRLRADRERTQLAAQQTAAQISAGGTVVGALSGPNAMIGAIGAAAGPIGTAVAGAVSQLASLGDTSQIDEDRLQEVMAAEGLNRDAALKQILLEDKALEFKVFFEAIVRGLAILPKILPEALLPVIIEGMINVTAALAQLPSIMLGVIIRAIGTGVKGISDFLKNLTPRKFGEAILNGLKSIFDFFFGPIINALSSVFGGDSMMGGGRFLSAQGGLRFTGRDSGLALLHSGETVVPRSGQMSSSVARDVEAQTGGGGVTININSAVTERSAIDSLVRKIEDRFGSFGQSTSPLFGGQ